MSETQNKIDESVPAYAAPPTAQPAQPEEPARMNAMQRLVGTLFSPGETFRDINRKPTIVVAIILGMILAAAGGLFFTWKVKPDWDRLIRAQIQKQVDRSGQSLTPEEMDKRVDMGKKIASVIPIFGPFVTAI